MPHLYVEEMEKGGWNGQLRTGRRRKGQTEEENPDVYHGPRARYFYYQCRQLVLRHQIDKLVSEWELPKEAKNICRAIWLLSLEILPNKPLAQPWIHAQTESERISPRKSTEEKPIEKVELKEEFQDGNQDGPSDTEDPDEGEEDTKEQIDREIEKLMYEASETESDSGSRERDTVKLQKAQNRDARHNLYDSTAMNISMLVLTCWWLRIPAIYLDFIHLINSYRIPYLDIMSLLTPNMRKHLSVDLRQRLNPSHAPTVTALHVITRRIARRLLTVHGITIPEFNAAPVLWRAVRVFQGPPILYVMAKRMMERLEVPLTVHPSLAPKPSLGIIGYGGDWAPTEVTMVASLIVILKMVYGFQEDIQVVPGEGDPASLFPEFSSYMAALQHEMENRRMDFESLLCRSNDVTADVLSEEKIDMYLNVSERVLGPLASGMKPMPFKQLSEIYSGIPLQNYEDILVSNHVPGVIPPESLRRPALHQEAGERLTKLPGESVITWSSSDPAGAFPPDYELLLVVGARWSGVERLTVSRLVGLFEKRLLRYTRRGRGADISDTDMDREYIDTDNPSTGSGSEKEDIGAAAKPEDENEDPEVKTPKRAYKLGSQNWREHVHYRLSKGARSTGAYKQNSSSEELEPESEDDSS